VAADDGSTNFWVMVRQAGELMATEQYAEAQPILQRLIELFPGHIGPSSAYGLLARTHRELEESDREREVLAAWSARDDEAVDAYRRLMELGEAAEDWETVWENAERFLAVNPLIPLPYRYRAVAAEALGRPASAAASFRAVLHLDPANPAAVHYALARVLHAMGEDPEARRQVLLALEDAPRFREALALLLELQPREPAAEMPAPGLEEETS
jgi:tetratricopeptide (TPR) repeat protein